MVLQLASYDELLGRLTEVEPSRHTADVRESLAQTFGDSQAAELAVANGVVFALLAYLEKNPGPAVAFTAKRIGELYVAALLRDASRESVEAALSHYRLVLEI